MSGVTMTVRGITLTNYISKCAKFIGLLLSLCRALWHILRAKMENLAG